MKTLKTLIISSLIIGSSAVYACDHSGNLHVKGQKVSSERYQKIQTEIRQRIESKSEEDRAKIKKAKDELANKVIQTAEVKAIIQETLVKQSKIGGI